MVRTDELLVEHEETRKIKCNQCQFCAEPWTRTLKLTYPDGAVFGFQVCPEHEEKVKSHQRSLHPSLFAESWDRKPEDVHSYALYCPIFWRSHGCDLPYGHGLPHMCIESGPATSGPEICSWASLNDPSLFL